MTLLIELDLPVCPKISLGISWNILQLEHDHPHTG